MNIENAPFWVKNPKSIFDKDEKLQKYNRIGYEQNFHSISTWLNTISSLIECIYIIIYILYAFFMTKMMMPLAIMMSVHFTHKL